MQRDPSPNSLDPARRRRGRRLAVLSHPAGMTHRNVFTDQLPTLALVGLGASEAWIGLQRAFEPVSQLLQLPTLRVVGRHRKRPILMAGQAIAVLGGLPLVAYGTLAHTGGDLALGVALASLWVTAVGIVISQTVWFPLLRSYVEPGRIGEFFGVLRTGWHLTLIAYFLGAQLWLSAHPGAFGALFGVATLAGLLRMLLIARLPDRSASDGRTDPRARGAAPAARSPRAAPLSRRDDPVRCAAARGAAVRGGDDAALDGALRRGRDADDGRVVRRWLRVALRVGSRRRPLRRCARVPLHGVALVGAARLARRCGSECVARRDDRVLLRVRGAGLGLRCRGHARALRPLARATTRRRRW